MTIDTIRGRSMRTGKLIDISGSVISYRVGCVLHWFLIWETTNERTGQAIHDVLDYKSGARVGSILNIAGMIGSDGGTGKLSDYDKAYLLIRTVTRQFGGSFQFNKALASLEILNPKYIRRDK